MAGSGCSAAINPSACGDSATRCVRRAARPRLVRVRRTHSGAYPGSGCPVPLVPHTACRKLVRVARAYSTEAPKANVSTQPQRRRARLPLAPG
eukprot:scaffold119623_cov42-Phaeocystis_antarctica.AAC.1